MINQIIDGVVAALDDAFGDDYPIYTENIEQGLEEPCFSVICKSPSEKQKLGKRYFKQNLICVHYFSTSAGGNRERNSIIEKLFSIMEYITCEGDLLRGTNMDVHTEDGVVIFNVNYNFFVHRVEREQETMDDLEVRESINE